MFFNFHGVEHQMPTPKVERHLWKSAQNGNHRFQEDTVKNKLVTCKFTTEKMTKKKK